MIWQVVPAAGLAVRLGKFLHDGYKKWDWRFCEQEQHLLHAHNSVMDVYIPTSSSHWRWKKALSGCDVMESGVPCLVRASTEGRVAIALVAAAPEPVSLPESFLDVLREWGNTWMWDDSLRLLGEDDWIELAIQEGLVLRSPMDRI